LCIFTALKTEQIKIQSNSGRHFRRTEQIDNKHRLTDWFCHQFSSTTFINNFYNIIFFAKFTLQDPVQLYFYSHNQYYGVVSWCGFVVSHFQPSLIFGEKEPTLEDSGSHQPCLHISDLDGKCCQ